MAIGWITALKIIPWGDVLEAAPHIVKGAKRLFAKSRDNETAVAEATPLQDAGPAAPLDVRLQRIQDELSALGAEQSSSAELIAALADQNSKVVEAIEILRVRTKLLLYTSAALAAALAALALWVLQR